MGKELIGQFLGRYHILEQLGEGGMATVYKAFDTRLEAEVAVKVIRTDSLPQNAVERTLKRFEREAKALARLTHPNIVKVTDYGEYEGSPYLVMPYLPGGTLKQKMGKPILWQDAARMLLPIASALEYAHEHDIIHRDIKPANILITEKGQTMLADFGIAKLIDAEETMELTGTSVGIGTPEYMAPEQATNKQVDSRVDIYALGVVFYEMVVGRKPYIADTPMAVMIMHSRDPLPRPRSFAPSLPQEVENILLKALAKNPKDRYQNMAELAAAMEKLIRSKSIVRKIAQPKFKSPTIPRRIVIRIGIFVLAIVLFSIFSKTLSTIPAQLFATSTASSTAAPLYTSTPRKTPTPRYTLTPKNPSAPFLAPVATLMPGEIYLGDLAPKSSTVGYGTFSVGAFRFTDRGNNITTGDPIIVLGKRYAHGLFAHAKSTILYSIRGDYKIFEAVIGKIESCGDGVIFKIVGDAKPLYESKKIISAHAELISVNVTGVSELVLIVEPVTTITCDTTVWGDPVLKP